MNILFLTCWYPTKEIPSKGIFIKEHAKAIHSAGNKIVVAALNVCWGKSFFEKEIEKFTDENGIETHIIHIRSLFYKWIYVNPFHLYKILKTYCKKNILADFSPALIHSNILSPCAILGDWLAKDLKKPHVITEHWSKVDNYMKKNIFSRYGKRAYQNAKAITVVSGFLKKNIEKYVNDASKIKIVPNVVDTKTFFYKPKIKSDKVIFTAVAHWRPPKEPMLFIEALNKMENKNSILNMVGEGEQLEAIKKLNLNFEIHYHGNIPRTKIAELLWQSDFFLHASQVETFSIVIAEALSTGTPVIASNVGAIPELVNETNGILTNNNPDDWQTAIEQTMNKKFDYARFSGDINSRFSVEKIAGQFNEIYCA
ncbi:MAG: glycosyltransferase family 4 protein [Bacteroidetes bacterium]|nr:glycosyltransferase family 4 protein [Bacteroidota bacterium]